MPREKPRRVEGMVLQLLLLLLNRFGHIVWGILVLWMSWIHLRSWQGPTHAL